MRNSAKPRSLLSGNGDVARPPLALVAPAHDPAPAPGDPGRPTGALDIMTARWRCHVIAARIAGVERATLERELRQMATQLDALYPT